MKIVIVSPAYPLRGGIANFTAQLYQELSLEHEVIVFTFKRQYPKIFFPGKTQLESGEDLEKIPTRILIDSINPLSWLSTAKEIIKLKPDLVISDISMPELSGLEAVSTIYERYPDVKVIFLSMYAGEDYIYHCLKAGGLSLINKDIPKEELLNAIHTVVKGKKYFGKDYTDENIQKIVSNYEMQLDTKEFIPNPELTDKEVEILLLIAEGLSSNDIADKLCIAKRTVDTHRTHIMQKLDLNSTPQLFKYATKYAEMIKLKDSKK